jgi:hypothetical protein
MTRTSNERHAGRETILASAKVQTILLLKKEMFGEYLQEETGNNDWKLLTD